MKKLVFAFAASLLFLSCSKKEEIKNSVAEKEAEVKPLPLDSLKKYADETKKLLVTNLTQKIADSGTVGAMAFCNIEALPLTKKMEEKYGVKIKRVTDKNRNPENEANETERKYIEMYRQQILKKEELKATMHDGIFYAPLVTNAMCLQCHGEKGKDIKPEVVAKISELYPNDKATGYKENEIRGLLRIAKE